MGLLIAYCLSAALFGWMLLSTVLSLVHCPFGIWFEDVRFNAIAWDAAILSPWLMNSFSFYLWPDRKALRLTEQIVGVLFIPIALFAITFSTTDLSHGVDDAFERNHILPLNVFQRIAAYRTNGGATTDYGMVVQQECIIFPGIILVKKIAGLYHAGGVSIELIDSHHLRCTFNSTRDLPDTELIQLVSI